MARIDIDPKYCISSEKKLALHIKMTKGWMELALKRPSRIDIANCAAHVEEHLLRTYGLIIEKNEDKNGQDNRH